MCRDINGGQKQLVEPLELELQLAVGCLMWTLGTKLGPLGGQQVLLAADRLSSLISTSQETEVRHRKWSVVLSASCR